MPVTAATVIHIQVAATKVVSLMISTNLLLLGFLFTDTEAPTVFCPTNQTLETDLNKSTALVVWTDLVATDNSKITPTVACNAQNGSQFEIGETEVMCQAVDQAGNLATCSFIIDVVGEW